MMFRALALTCALAFPAAAHAQTAAELVAKNLAARGGADKLRAIKTVRWTGHLEGAFKAALTQEDALPGLVRETFAVQGMTQVEAYDGRIGWQINPFQGRRDPEQLGENDMRDLLEDADPFPLLDAQTKGSKIELIGHTPVDGDDAIQLNVTLKNGDVFKYFLDPDTFLEIRIERQQFIHGSVRETVSNVGSYKLVNGVYFAFWSESGPKNAPDQMGQVTWDKIETNVALPAALFKMPAASSTPPPPNLPEPPGNEPKPNQPPQPVKPPVAPAPPPKR